jgi:hypothetical protein
MKLDLLTNATVVDDAIRFVSACPLYRSQKSNDKASKEPYYDEDKDRLKKEQEEETGEITVNQVF